MAKDYVPGTDGKGPGPEMPHYRVEIDAKVWNGTSFKAKQELIKGRLTLVFIYTNGVLTYIVCMPITMHTCKTIC